jgi:hypothetical protein
LNDLNKEDVMNLIDLSLQIKDKEWFKELSKRYKELENNNVINNEEDCYNKYYSEYYEERDDIEDNTYMLMFDWHDGQIGFLIGDTVKEAPESLEELRNGIPVNIVSDDDEIEMCTLVNVEYLDMEKTNYCIGYWEGYLESTESLINYITDKEKKIKFLKSENKLLDRLVNTLENMLLNNCKNDKKWWQFWKK